MKTADTVKAEKAPRSYLDVADREVFRTKAEVLNALNAKTKAGKPYKGLGMGSVALYALKGTSVWFINRCDKRVPWTNIIEADRILESTAEGTKPVKQRRRAETDWTAALEKANAGLTVKRVTFVCDEKRAWRFQGVYRLRPAASDPLPEQLVWELIATQFEYQA